MPRPPALDPEVLADLRARERSESDRSRVGEFTFGDPTIVEHWPCRTGCGAMLGVTDATIFALDVHNALLARRREQPIAKTKVMWCPKCKAKDDELAAMQRRPMRQTELNVDEKARK
jgi:hypothetical protein